MKLKYEPSLDGLRAVAVLAVLGFHFARPLVPAGSLGVDVFFVLSGWLITSVLVSEAEVSGRIDYRAFLIRRARRLLPALGLLLAAYLVAAPYLFPGEIAERRWFDVSTAAFYVTNLRQAFWPVDTPLSHTWSLAIEEQFYLLWPAVIAGLVRLKRQHASSVLLVLWAVVTLARNLYGNLHPTSWLPYYFTPFHCTGLLLGAAAALRPPRFRLGLAALIVLAELMFFGRSLPPFVDLTAIAEIATALVILCPPAILAWKPAAFLGRISYGTYLWHVPLMWVAGDARTLPAAAPLLGASILAGWLSYELVERHFLRAGSTLRWIVPTLRSAPPLG